jgi:hypothetical protein
MHTIGTIADSSRQSLLWAVNNLHLSIHRVLQTHDHSTTENATALQTHNLSNSEEA